MNTRSYYGTGAYAKIMEQYKDVVDLKTGFLFSQNGKASNGINGVFQHIPSQLGDLYGLKRMAELFQNASFLDIGSGLGNILRYAKELGFGKVWGIESNLDLIKYNEGLDVVWDNVFKRPELLKIFDIIYLYRPLFETTDMERLISFIKKNSKDDVVIHYNGSHYPPNTEDEMIEGWYNWTDFSGEYSYFFKSEEKHKMLLSNGAIYH